MIVLDANIVIALLDANNAGHERSRSLLDELAEEPWALHALTLAEILVGPARTGQLEAVRAHLDALGIEVIALDAGSSSSLAQLRAETTLKMPDCCIVLAAEQTGGQLATFDRRLAAAARSRGLEVLG